MKVYKAVIVVLCVFMVIGLSSCAFNDAFAKDVYEIRTVDGATVTGLWVDVSVANVTVSPTSDTDVSVTLTGRSSSDNLGFSVSENDGTVIVKCTPKSWGWTDLTLDILIPESIKGDEIYVAADTGKIAVERLTVSGGVSLETSTGGINSSSMRASAFSAKTDTGNVSLADIDTVSLTAEADTGSVSVDCVSQPANVDIKTSTGTCSLTLPGSSSFHIVAETSTGSVDCSDFTFSSTDTNKKNKVSGTVTGSSDKISDIWMRASTGSIKVKRR
ncbi:MAG: DUF4097 domain-containing protein [Spirochaetaceae bacterium]|nr:DUF4097 domain-containing protein [Spirochaetaceae bacterium]